MAAEGDAQARVHLVGEQHGLVERVLAQIVLVAFGGLHLKTLHIGVALLVGIVEHGRPHLVGPPFLYHLYVVLVVVVHIEVGDVELAVVEHHEYGIVFVELAQQGAVLVVVEAFHIGVEPHLAAAQCAVAVAL